MEQTQVYPVCSNGACSKKKLPFQPDTEHDRNYICSKCDTAYTLAGKLPVVSNNMFDANISSFCVLETAPGYVICFTGKAIHAEGKQSRVERKVFAEDCSIFNFQLPAAWTKDANDLDLEINGIKQELVLALATMTPFKLRVIDNRRAPETIRICSRLYGTLSTLTSSLYQSFSHIPCFRITKRCWNKQNLEKTDRRKCKTMIAP